MKIRNDCKSGLLRVWLIGELDHHCAGKALDSVVGLIDESMAHDCVIDLSELSFMDSSGIAVILRTQKYMNESGGKAWVENPKGQPLRVLDASGIDRVIGINGAARREGTYDG